MKRIFTLTLAAVALLMTALPAMAQEMPNAKILVVDFQRVTTESLVGKDVAAQISSNRIDIEARAGELEEQLRKEEQDLGAQKSIMDQNAFNERVRALQQRAQAARVELQERQQGQQRAVQQAQLEIQRTLRPIIKQVMDDRGATMVMDKNLVSHHVAGLDVTTLVIEKLNETLPSFEISLPDKK